MRTHESISCDYRETIIIMLSIGDTFHGQRSLSSDHILMLANTPTLSWQNKCFRKKILVDVLSLSIKQPAFFLVLLKGKIMIIYLKGKSKTKEIYFRVKYLLLKFLIISRKKNISGSDTCKCINFKKQA